MLFEQSQASFDPNTIMALLQQHPYHVDALLTMHELYRLGLSFHLALNASDWEKEGSKFGIFHSNLPKAGRTQSLNSMWYTMGV